MSGGTPLHLYRRGPVYGVRFRLPTDLVARLGLADLRRSLHTKDIAEARRRCLAATVWYHKVIEQLRMNVGLTRADLERAAQAYFAELSEDLLRPRTFLVDAPSSEAGSQIDLSNGRIDELNEQVRLNIFDPVVVRAAREVVTRAGGRLEDVDAAGQALAGHLAARALKEQLRRYIAQLTDQDVLAAADALFAQAVASPNGAPVLSVASPRHPGDPLDAVVEIYLAKKRMGGRGPSQLAELTRLFIWMGQALGQHRPIDDITKAEVRQFRDDLQRIDVTFRGQKAEFKHRLTNDASKQLKSATAIKYWQSALGFFAWAVADGHATTNPAVGLTMDKHRDEETRTPEPFTQEELQALLKTPLYAGHKSSKRLTEPGGFHIRAGHWWSGILLMHTGMRAGELSQLLPSDFDFDSEVPYLRVSREDGDGNRVKSVKNSASVRKVPLHPRLLELGLREFVAARAKKYPSKRLFWEFRVDTAKGRHADGMTAFWRRYLDKFKLAKPGRATHVWRHTFVEALRRNHVSEEDIGSLVGHSGRSQTSKYGAKDYPLERKSKALEKLDYGFSVTGALGGPYDPACHRP